MKETISRFAPPTFLIVLGLGLVITAFTSNQNALFITAGFSIIVAGLITLLNAMGFITNKTAMMIAIVLIGLAGYLGFANYKSIDGPIQFNKEKKIRYAEVIQNLKDLREVELAYKKEHKVFCGSMDTLMNFLKNDSVYMVKMFGNVPDTLTEAEALEQGIIRRDTTLFPAYEIAFNDEYMSTRDPKYPLDMDKLRYVPYTDKVEFAIEAGEITRSSGAKVQVFEIRDAAPFDENDVMMVGSMTEPTISGNWKEEK